MQSSTRRKAVLGLCIVTVLIAALVVFLSSRPGLDSVKPQPAEPEGHSEAEDSQHLALESAEVANEVEVADEVDEQVLEEHLGSLVEAPDVPRPALARLLEQRRKHGEEILRQRRAMRATRYARIERYFTEVPLYQQIEAEIKEKLFAEYGRITDEEVPALLDHAIELKETFWKNGDFDHVENFDVICQSRALLEMSLEADPANEVVLSELIDVLQSGWPKVISREYADKKHEFLGKQHKYDIRIAMQRLWSEHLSKRDASTPQDMAYALDILLYCWTDAEQLQKFESMVKEFNPQASQELQEFVRKSISSGQNMAVAEWAVACAQKMGKEKRFYLQMFSTMIEQMKRGERPIPQDTGFIILKDLTSYSDFAAKIRFCGRGASFVGTAKRKEFLEPYHVAWLAAHPE